MWSARSTHVRTAMPSLASLMAEEVDFRVEPTSRFDTYYFPITGTVSLELKAKRFAILLQKGLFYRSS